MVCFCCASLSSSWLWNFFLSVWIPCFYLFFAVIFHDFYTGQLQKSAPFSFDSAAGDPKSELFVTKTRFVCAVGKSNNISDNIDLFSPTTASNSSFGKSQLSEAVSERLDETNPSGKILETPNLKVFSFADLRSATKNFKSDTLLGEGGFGKVYKGWMDTRTLVPSKIGSGMVVAIKKLNSESMQGFQEWQVIFFVFFL